MSLLYEIDYEFRNKVELVLKMFVTDKKKHVIGDDPTSEIRIEH